jgi:SAM-dependent methyltransferase
MNQNKVKAIISSYPRKRRALPIAYQELYTQHYINNREGKTSAASLSQQMEKWMHKKVAGDLKQNDLSKRTLEIGAGTLNQLEYEPLTTYDIVEPFKELYVNSKALNRINQTYNDIKEVNDVQYDRIISIAAFEHIDNLPYVVAKTGRVLKKDGTLRVAIPNEGTILWKLGWMFTTGLEFKLKYNLNYATLLNHEHINNADEIETVLNYFYNSINCKVFGVHKKIGFYRFYECKNPRIGVIQNYLEQYEFET